MSIDWQSIRADYPALANGRAYLDTACMGVAGSRAEHAIAEHVKRLREIPAASTTDLTIAMLAAFDRARTAIAQLVNADAAEIALVPSTESGIAVLAAALALEPGSTVIASDLEFIGTVLPWRFRSAAGIELKFVPHRNGIIDLDDLDSAIDARTRAVVVSSVQEVNGFRVDLARLSALCQSRGILLIVDAIQHVGPLPLDLRETPVDAVAVGGHKWLCAPFGMGFLYVSRPTCELLRPPARAFMTAAPPEGGWSDYLESAARHPADPLAFPADARALEAGALGTTLAAVGLAAAVETLLEIGPAAIAERSAALVRATIDELRAADVDLATPTDGPQSSIVTFRYGEGVDDERRLIQQLAAAGVLTSLRYTTGVGGIRVSPYFYNDENDVDRLISIVARVRSGTSTRVQRG